MKNQRGQFLIAPMILAALFGVARADEQLSLLQAGNDRYTNITVTSVSATDVYFTYAGGMANVKIKILSPDLQKHFSFDPKQAKAEELKQAGNNLKYHDQLLHQSGPKPADTAGDRLAPRVGIYGEVPEKYVPSTVTRSGDISPLTGIHTIDGQDLDFHGKPVVIDSKMQVWWSSLSGVATSQRKLRNFKNKTVSPFISPPIHRRKSLVNSPPNTFRAVS